MSLCVVACLKGERFLWVWVRERVHASLCAFLCVNDSSVTMCFGESDLFMIQRGNSVCHLSYPYCDNIFKLCSLLTFV
jgi:hypothetical protein